MFVAEWLTMGIVLPVHWLGIEFSAYSSLDVDSPGVLQVTNAWRLLSHPVTLIGLELSV
jgi:hypothetical protein